MKKRLGMLLLALALCLSLAVPAFAAEGFADEYYRLYDEGELLTEEEEAALLEKLDVLSEKLRFDLVIITEKDLSGSTPESMRTICMMRASMAMAMAGMGRCC